MAEIINMPRLSDTMEEGTVAKWLKKVGDKVSEGDILAEIETDKATMEFESFNEGVLLYIGIQEEESAPVDSLLAIIGEEGEDISALISGASSSDSETVSEEESAAVEVEEVKESASETIAIPDGVQVINMPRLSDTMTEGTVATWLKKVGDEVSEGDILAEIETDKATMEFESFNEGTLLHIGIQEGESALVDSLLAIIGPKETDLDAVLKSVASGASTNSVPQEEVTKVETNATVEDTKVEAVTKASSGRVLASPLAKKIALEKGIDISNIKGTGENGRVVKKDVEGYTPSVAKPVETTSEVPDTPKVAVETFVPVGEESFEEIKNSQMRKVIARRLGESKFSAPHYYLTIEVDMDNAIASRKIINAIPDTKVSFNDLVVKATAMALKKHPQVNSQWFEDKMKLNHHVHIGVAVAVEDGLVVPVVKFTDQQTLQQIGVQVKDYASRARSKKLTPAEMEGSTFTVSNLGMFGIKEFTSIINQPNSAILSVGAIVQKPVVKNGEIVVGNTMTLTLACDHRTVDGATGAAFLQTFKQYLENPVTMLA